MTWTKPPLFFSLNELCQCAIVWKIKYDGHERQNRHSSRSTFGAKGDVGVEHVCMLPKGQIP
jgi:hypothetical protein